MRYRLHFLDGIRGICALYIATYHAQLYTGHNDYKDINFGVVKSLSLLFSFGYLAVPIFIVLSGFCLAIPVANSESPNIKGGFTKYIGRRAKRILPPYYFALFMFIIMIWAIPILKIESHTAWDSKIPMDTMAIVSHVLLIQNFNLNWVFKIDGPLWSVATEWQLYFAFPVLIYLWKKIGLINVTVLSILVSLIISAFLLPAKVMHLWFLGLFSLGILGANITFSKEPKWQKFREDFPWRIFTNITLLVVTIFVVIGEHKNMSPKILETLIGFGAITLIIHYSTIEIYTDQKPVFLRLLNSKFLMILGTFSYSVYLIHSPLLGLFNLLTLRIPMTALSRWIIMEAVAVPVAVGISYVFYLLIERKFMPGHSKKELVKEPVLVK
jgi:peptidoglycan/LPS O-acetylase OafA/YrhL